MNAHLRPRALPKRPCPHGRHETGGYLIEALIAILIFSFGVLGIVGLVASSMRFTADAQYRSEAVFLANAYIAQMWADDRNTLAIKYKDAGQTGYDAFKNQVDLLPGAAAIPANPLVEFSNGPTATSTNLRIVVRWQMPGDVIHQYESTGTIGQNP